MSAVVSKSISLYAPPAYAGGNVGPSLPSGNTYQINAGAIYNVAPQDVSVLVGQGFSTQPYGAQSGLIALAGGGAPGATQLNYGVNEIATVATANDSCILPPAIPGAEVFVANDDGTSATQIFGIANPWNANAVDTIDGTAGATGVSLAGTSSTRGVFRCDVLGKWVSIAGAKV